MAASGRGRGAGGPPGTADGRWAPGARGVWGCGLPGAPAADGGRGRRAAAAAGARGVAAGPRSLSPRAPKWLRPEPTGADGAPGWRGTGRRAPEPRSSAEAGTVRPGGSRPGSGSAAGRRPGVGVTAPGGSGLGLGLGRVGRGLRSGHTGRGECGPALRPPARRASVIPPARSKWASGRARGRLPRPRDARGSTAEPRVGPVPAESTRGLPGVTAISCGRVATHTRVSQIIR